MAIEATVSVHTTKTPSNREEEQKLSLESSPQSQIHTPKLTEAVKKALGYLATDIQECHKEFGLPLEIIVPFITTTIAKLFQKDKESILFGGFRQEGELKKKWKILVELDRNREITEIFIGRLQASGCYASAYYTFNEKVILVSKKKEDRSVVQMLSLNLQMKQKRIVLRSF